jgi:peptidyl-prolyl cis-trans isomerase SurA
MRSARCAATVALVAFGLFAAPSATRAEIVEEIIAWVNGDVITLSEYDQEQQERIAEIYRQHSGEELDREVELAREQLLLNMIDRKILVHYARAIGTLDIDAIGESLLDQFMRNNEVETREELKQMAEEGGMDLDQVKSRMIEMYVPNEIIRYEVAGRISVSESEIEGFYQENATQFYVEGEVTLREIVLLANNTDRKAERREEALQIWRQAAAGESFPILAKEFSEAGTAADGGLLGPLKRSDLAEALSEAAFTLPVGEVSELKETPYGFHIIKVDSRIDDHVKPLTEVQSGIRHYLRSEKMDDDFDAFLERAREESDWCVKPKHQHLLSIPAPPPCERL